MHTLTKFLFYALFLFLLLWIFASWLLPFLFPFLLGALPALAAEPLVRLLSDRLRLPRAVSAGIGVSLAFLVFGGILFLLFLLVFQLLSGLSRILPSLSDAVLSGLSLLEQWLLALSFKAPLSLQAFLRARIRELFSGGTAFLSQAVRYIFTLAGGAISHIPGQAFTLFTAVLSGFMISAKLPKLRSICREFFSRQQMQEILSFLKKLKKILGHWLLAEMKLASVTLLIIFLGFVLLKIPYALFWALALSLLDALPLFGTGIVLIPWSLISFLQNDPARGLGLLAVYITAALSRSLLEPRFVGKQLGLDPLMTLGAMYAGFRIWGFPGMIFSPLLAVTAFSLIAKPEDPQKAG